jgi:hypothetical protein
VIEALDLPRQLDDASQQPRRLALCRNVWDPDGNHLHIDFDLSEAEAAGVVSP